MNTRRRSAWNSFAPAILATTIFLLAGFALAEEGTDTRSSATSQGQGIARGGLTDGAIQYDEHAALGTQGERARPAHSDRALKSTADGAAQKTANTDFWIYAADVILFSDLDRDGYYYGIDLAFDADTIYAAADVYAVIYLSLDFGPWNEYVQTETFSIFGATGDDEYVVETELLSGYPTGDYDLLIELYDAFDDSFVASFGPDDSSALAFLPLEDVGRDTPIGTTVVVNNGGGGSFGLVLLALLVGIAALRRTNATSV